MVVNSVVAAREGLSTETGTGERLTAREMFCAPLLSALLFGGGAAGIADVYVHIRDIVPLSGRDWESNPMERRLARWHGSLACSIHHFVRVGVLREDGTARWALTDKGYAVAREFSLVSRDGVLIDRALLRKKLPEFAAGFERMYRVISRPAAVVAPTLVDAKAG